MIFKQKGRSMPTPDIYNLKLQGTYLGQAIEADFHYLQTVGTANADNLGNEFLLTKLVSIKTISSSSVNYTRIAVQNLSDPTDFWEDALSDVGDQSGSNMQSFGTWSFTYLTNRSDSKSGGKRLAGCLEEQQNAGVAVATQLIRLAAVAVSLGQNISADGSTWRPCVYGSRAGSIGRYANVLSGVRYLGMSTMRSRIFYK